MPRTKLKRLIQIKELPNVFSIEQLKTGSVTELFLKDKGLISLEIGCGHGNYSVEMGQRFPQRIFIGIDLKAARLFNGAVKAAGLKLNNVAFIIGNAEKLKEIFPPNSIEEIYIAFPDPHIRRRNEKKRLISPFYLNIYKKLLVESGEVHLKTDNEFFFEYALETISGFGCKILDSTRHLYSNETMKKNSGVVTTYERFYIKEGKPIMYLRFKF